MSALSRSPYLWTIRAHGAVEVFSFSVSLSLDYQGSSLCVLFAAFCLPLFLSLLLYPRPSLFTPLSSPVSLHSSVLPILSSLHRLSSLKLHGCFWSGCATTSCLTVVRQVRAHYISLVVRVYYYNAAVKAWLASLSQ